MKPQQDPFKGIELDAIATTEQHDQWQALLNATFKVEMGKKFFDDFPIWRRDLTPQPQLKIGAYQGKLLVASAAARISQVKLWSDHESTCTIPIALIGGVATYEKFRSRGFATQLVKHLCEWSQNRGALAVVLWGSEYSLYSKLGFDYAGTQVRVPLNTLITPTPEGKCESKIQTGFHPLILKLMKKRQGGLVLENKDLLWMTQHKNTEWYWIEKESEPVAYAAFGRGIDLSGLVHEWSGDAQDVLRLMGHIHALHPDAQLLGSPLQLKKRNIEFDEKSVEILCMGRSFSAGFDFSQLWLWGLDSV